MIKGMERKSVQEHPSAAYILNLSTITKEKELWDLVEERLPVPSYFGRNLDAWADWLSEPQKWQIKIQGEETFVKNTGAYGKIFLELLRKNNA